jgi:methylmalonyl-CoA/ethylmalonyl-CoA epimerase
MSNDEVKASSGVQLKRAVQVGVVVRDLEHTTQLLSSLGGIGPFQFIEWPNRPDSKYCYRGEEQHIKIRQAFVQLGGIELELVQPLEGKQNAYQEFLDQQGGGIHHILFEVEDMDAVIETMAKAGVGVLQSGTGIRPGTRWALLDSRQSVGFLVELRQRAPGCDGTSIPEEKS